MYAILIHHYNGQAELNPEIYTIRRLAEQMADDLTRQVQADELMRGDLMARSFAEVIEVRMA